MNLFKNIIRSKNRLRATIILNVLAFASIQAAAQIESQPQLTTESPKIETAGLSNSDAAKNKFNVEDDFRVEKTPVAGGSEIITIFANFKGLAAGSGDLKNEIEVPLVSILRDTLGDQNIENDRLRYVWMLSYVKPSLAQKFAAGIPFLYRRTTNKGKVKNSPPPAVIDLHPTKKEVWNKVFWLVFRNLIVDNFTIPARAATMQYKSNADNYRKASITRALAVLSLYETIEGEKVLSDAELRDIQARMMLSDKFFGSLTKSENLERVYDTNAEKIIGFRGQNWELLRQYAEAQGLYFEPLTTPDGSATHAVVWLAEGDLEGKKDRDFDARFLNVKNPWTDSRLNDWKGYSEVRWFNEQNRQIAPNTPNAYPRKMIPLALYGLEYPKIPVLLIDFRDQNNPKKRELSRRILNDATRNVLSISRLDNLPYFVGRYVYDFVTQRRGIDMNQATRLRSYSQLKLLLALDASLDPKFRNEIAERLETVSLNPLENDLDVEVKLARKQYENLMIYAKHPDGLSAQIEKDRREEMTRLKHTGRQRFLYSLGRTLSLGIYSHREKYTPELRSEMDLRRRLDYHERFLRETARTSAKPEVDSDLEAVRDSLKFLAVFGTGAQPKTAEAVAKLFSITADEEIRAMCLESLYRIDNSTAKKQLLAIYYNQTNDNRWRTLSAQYLKRAVAEEQRIQTIDAKTIIEINE